VQTLPPEEVASSDEGEAEMVAVDLVVVSAEAMTTDVVHRARDPRARYVRKLVMALVDVGSILIVNSSLKISQGTMP
jgi:hypothetical protein